MTTTPLHFRYTDAVETYNRAREDMSRTPAQRAVTARQTAEARTHVGEQMCRSAMGDAAIDPLVFRAALKDFLEPIVSQAVSRRIRALHGRLD